jgi:nucleotide-binding universal stress UspA family protein
MRAAIDDMLSSSPRDVVVVAHQFPIWMARVALQRRGDFAAERLPWLFVRGRCEYASVTTLTLDAALRVRECAEEAATVLRAGGFAAETEVAAGRPATLLLERSSAYDLVAVGSRGLGAVRRSLLGSLSDKLVRHARATLVAR